MTAIIIDLEWNYPVRGTRGVEGLPHEIIQIGAGKIDGEANITDTFSEFVRPKYYTRLNKDVAELTLIKNEELQGAKSFPEVMEAFRSWCGGDFVFITWSGTDIRVLERNFIKHGMDTGWLPPVYDAQLMFDDMEMQEDRSWPLNYALYHYNEKPDGAHNALADVYSTALVLKHLDLADGLSDDFFRCDRGAFEEEDER